MLPRTLLLLLLLWCWTVEVAWSSEKASDTAVVTIATFNIQKLGKTKVKKKQVMATLDKIFERYDVVMVQEVQDTSGKAPSVLNATINAKAVSACDKFSYVLSERVGRTRGETEQYATFYRPCLVTALRHAHYNDPDDVFTRDPFLTEIQFKNSELPRLVLANVHAKPDATGGRQTVKEIQELASVYDYIRKRFDTENAILAGDMNADGDYVRMKEWERVKLKNDRRFSWLVSDDVDTTVGDTDRAYDRIIVAGGALIDAIVPGSTIVFRFDEHLPGANGGTMTQKEAKQVSDHYPVEFQVRLR